MKILVRTVIYVLLLLVVSSCAENAPGFISLPNFDAECVPGHIHERDHGQDLDVHDYEFVDENTENVLLQQVLHGYQCEAVYGDSVKYTLQENDMLALGDVLAMEMAKRGLELNPVLFKKRLEATYGIKADRLCYYSLTERRMELYMVPELYKPEPKYDFKINLSESRYNHVEEVALDPRIGLMFPIMFLPEIINYAEKYPEIKKAEKIAVMPKKSGTRVKKWSQEKTVLPNHGEVLSMIFHINNYIIYENLESLDWLVKNCMPVLQSMFVDFRMEHNPIIDSLVLVRARSGGMRIESLFAERNSDGSVYVREGLLDYISQKERMKAPRFHTTIRQYVAGCFGYDVYYDRTERFPQVLLDNFTIEERRMIVAKIMNTVFSLYSGVDSGKIMKIILDRDPEFLDFAAKKNYYGLENLRSGLSVYRMRFRAQKWRTITPLQGEL